MSSLGFRWTAVSSLAAASFAACWAILQFGEGVSGAEALGWAVVPLSIVLAVGGGWAEWARRKAERPDSATPAGSDLSEGDRVTQKQRAAKNARQLQVGRDINVTKKDD